MEFLLWIWRRVFAYGLVFTSRFRDAWKIDRMRPQHLRELYDGVVIVIVAVDFVSWDARTDRFSLEHVYFNGTQKILLLVTIEHVLVR